MSAEGYTSDPTAVDSVNGETGTVVLDAGDVDAIPTATLASLLKVPAGNAEQEADWSAVDQWLRVNSPYSAGDTNPDFLRMFNSQPSGADIRTFWINGNLEVRRAPSRPGRVGARDYEFLDGSTDEFWQVSTNPTNSALRESLVAVVGTLHPTMPGWMLIRETIQARSLVATETLSVAGQSLVYDSAWSDATLAAGFTAGTAIAPGTRMEGDRVFGRGRVGWTTSIIAGSTLLATIVNTAHRPASRKTCAIRTIGANSNVSTVVHIDPNGQITNEANFGTNASTAYFSMDGLSYDLE